MPIADHDPRVFFAAERTLLAGALASLVATVQHRRFVSGLPQIDLPQSYSGAFGAAFGFFIAAVGLVLAVYLGVSQ